MKYSDQLNWFLEILLLAYKEPNKEKLDAEGRKTSHSVISEYARIELGLKDWEIQVRLEFLLKEGMIKSIQPLEISFEGLIFIEDGGYVKQNEISILNLDIQRNEMKRRNRNDLLVVLGTISAALGTFLIFLLEIKKIYPLFPCLTCL